MPDEPRATGLAARGAMPSPSPAAPAARVTTIAAAPGIKQLLAPRRVVNQGEVQCCVSCALAGALEVMNQSYPALAPLFHYYITRFEVLGGADAEGFLFLQPALATLRVHGICEHTKHDRSFTKPDAARGPSGDARVDAKRRRLTRLVPFRPLRGPSWSAAIRQELQLNRPVVIGFRLPAEYPERFPTRPRFEWMDPGAPAMSNTGHCVLVTGFNDARTALRIHDSQGDDAFEKGQWWMGYRVADRSIREAYSLL